MNITLADLFLILYVTIDDWHQCHYSHGSKVGRRAQLTDSEMLTLLMAMDFVEFSSERHYVAFIRANYCPFMQWNPNYLALFPNMLDHSQYNRRSRLLLSKLEILRQYLAKGLGSEDELYRIIDTTPVPVVGYRRCKQHSDFVGSANYGYCAARKLHYYGYKLVLECTLSGIPGQIELVPANTDERAAADEIIPRLLVGSCLIGDKGFIDADWQNAYQAKGIEWLTPRRKNQAQQLSTEATRLINRVRERVEGVYKVLKEGGRSIEKALAHTVDGLCCRVVAKIASITARMWLKEKQHINVLTFSAI